MGNKPAGANGKRSYEDFDPFCLWHKEEGCDTLDIHLEGFKKPQLHVETKKGNLVIWGEKPLHPSKWRRFCKEVRIQKDWKEEEIRPELSGNGVLSIRIPKRPQPTTTIGRYIGRSFSRAKKSFSKSQISDTYLAMVSLLINLLMFMVMVAIVICVAQKCRRPADN